MKTVHRKNVVLSSVSAQRIKAIREAKDINSDAEAIREALRLYDDLMQKQMEGFTVTLTHPNKELKHAIPDLFDKRMVVA